MFHNTYQISHFLKTQLHNQFIYEGFHIRLTANSKIRFGYNIQGGTVDHATESECPCDSSSASDLLIKFENKKLRVMCRSRNHEDFELCGQNVLDFPQLDHLFVSILAGADAEQSPHLRVHNMFFESQVEQFVALFDPRKFSTGFKTLFHDIRSARHISKDQIASNSAEGVNLATVQTGYEKLLSSFTFYNTLTDRNLEETEDLQSLLDSQSGLITKYRISIINELKGWAAKTIEKFRDMNAQVSHTAFLISQADSVKHYNETERKIAQFVERLKAEAPRLQKVIQSNKQLKENLDFIRSNKNNYDNFLDVGRKLQALIESHKQQSSSLMSMSLVVGIGLVIVICLCRIHAKIGKSSRIDSLSGI